MSRPSASCPDRPDLAALLKQAALAYASMSPEQKREHQEAQRKSWVIGEMMLAHPDMTRSKAERLYLEVVL